MVGSNLQCDPHERHVVEAAGRRNVQMRSMIGMKESKVQASMEYGPKEYVTGPPELTRVTTRRR